MAKRDYARAILEFRNAARLNPKDPGPAYQLGLAYLDSGDYRAGVASLLHTVELDPEHASAQLKIAELTSGAGPEEFGGAVLELAEKRLRTILAAWGGEADVSALSSRSETTELEKRAARDPKERLIKSHLFRAYMIERRFPEAERLIDSMLEQTRARQRRAQRISFLKRLLKHVFTENSEKASDEDTQNPDQEQPADPSVLQVETNAELEQQRQNLENADGLAQRAHLYLATARAKEAEQDLLQALKLNRSDGLAHYLMSIVHQVHNSEHARRDELARAGECNPAWLAARLELARARTEIGDGYAALATLEQAPKAQQSDLAFIVERNRALLEVDDRRALQESLQKALAVAKTPSLLLQEGFLQLRMNDLAEARRFLDMVLELDPENVSALNARSESYLAGNQPDLALSTLHQHVSRYPNSAGLQYLLGVWLVRFHRPAEASAAFKAAVQARPGFLPAMEKLLDLEIAEGNPSAARQTIALMAAAPGGKAPAELALGVLEERPGGNTQSAIAHYRNVLNQDPDNVPALNNLAYHLAGDKSGAEEALSLALRVKRLDPANPSVDDTIGWAYYNRGSYSLAIEYFEAAVARQPNAQREYHLAMAYLKAGDAKKARATLQAALKMDDRAPEASLSKQLIEPETRQ